jgi:hypothetical protein
MYKIAFLLALIVFQAAAQSSNFASVGYAAGGAAYLQLPVTAQAASLCGAATAWRDNLVGTEYNPAIYDALTEGSYFLSGTYSVMTLDRKHIGVSAAATVGSYLVVGLSFINAGVNNIESRDSVGNLDGTFNYNENAVAVSVAGRLLWHISLGATLRYLNEGMLNGNANGLGADVGATWQPVDFLCVGVSVQNIGGTLWWNTGHSDPVLTTFRAGIEASFLKNSLRAELDMLKPLQQPEEAALGLQYTLFNIVSVRGGMSLDIDAASMHSSYPDYGVGVGVHYSFFGFDYGLWIPDSDLGLTHKFTISFLLGNPFN